MKNEQNLEPIKQMLWVKKMTVTQLAAACKLNVDEVTDLLDELDDDVLQSEFCTVNKTVKYWILKTEFCLQSLVINILKDLNGVATRIQIAEKLQFVPLHQIDSAIKNLKNKQQIHTVSRGVLALGDSVSHQKKEVALFDTEIKPEGNMVECTDTVHGKNVINALYDPKVMPAFFQSACKFRMLNDGSLILNLEGRGLMLNPKDSEQVFTVLNKVYGRAL
ncbi:hypothetical protein [Vitreoscilla stercoraria]|uniref:Uncharacterized protein n=1 Tax=Vitreoscilla stercoraria TaxID=61 RepID=A0ABY4EEF9_VITST|nr:hypothetical protein [Vitreoscilla stercoraria]UOO93604.1 hypothetical protein LVJ81_06155 [Vitreoscilla stercoraria]